MRISDWSSDVCSSDLLSLAHAGGVARGFGSAALARMRDDLVFDIEPARRDFGYAPRPFEPEAAMFGGARASYFRPSLRYSLASTHAGPISRYRSTVKKLSMRLSNTSLCPTARKGGVRGTSGYLGVDHG